MTTLDKSFFRFVLSFGVALGCLLSIARSEAADPPAQVPAIIREGFAAWVKQGPSYAMDAWKKGGALEDDRKPSVLVNTFKELDRTVGDFRAYEIVDTKRVGVSTQIVYLAINFERAAIYGRFLLYRGDKVWVVQNMDFSLKPEAVMPWLAFQGVDYTQ